MIMARNVDPFEREEIFSVTKLKDVRKPRWTETCNARSIKDEMNQQDGKDRTKSAPVQHMPYLPDFPSASLFSSTDLNSTAPFEKCRESLSASLAKQFKTPSPKYNQHTFSTITPQQKSHLITDFAVHYQSLLHSSPYALQTPKKYVDVDRQPSNPQNTTRKQFPPSSCYIDSSIPTKVTNYQPIASSISNVFASYHQHNYNIENTTQSEHSDYGHIHNHYSTPSQFRPLTPTPCVQSIMRYNTAIENLSLPTLQCNMSNKSSDCDFCTPPPLEGGYSFVQYDHTNLKINDTMNSPHSIRQNFQSLLLPTLNCSESDHL